LEKIQRKSRELENFPQTALFTPLIYRNVEGKTIGSFPSDLRFNPKRTRKQNEFKHHALVPMHKERG
jgi:hypothetical protein